jgi:hypothetical protein
MTDTTLAERLVRCVKPLGWTKDARYPETIDTTPTYCIVPDKGTERYRFWIGSDDWSVGFWPTLEAAKAAAQADYTARILATLDMDALAQEVEAMVGQEKRIEELTAALKEVTLHRDQLLEVSDRLFDDVAALFARQIELQDAIENAARMAEQGILSMDGRLAASEIRSLAPSEIRSLAPRSSTPVDPVAEAAKVLLADLRNREGGKP